MLEEREVGGELDPSNNQLEALFGPSKLYFEDPEPDEVEIMEAVEYKSWRFPIDEVSFIM